MRRPSRFCKQTYEETSLHSETSITTYRWFIWAIIQLQTNCLWFKSWRAFLQRPRLFLSWLHDVNYLRDGLKRSSHGVSNASAISRFLLTMTKHLLAWARWLTLATLLLLYRLRTSKEMKKIYTSYDAQDLNHHGSLSGHEISIYFFGQIRMWKKTLHPLGEEYQCV